MPKMKSHRGAAKRFKKTGTGKISRSKNNKQHILTKKTTKRKRRLRKSAIVAMSIALFTTTLVPQPSRFFARLFYRDERPDVIP